MDIFLGQTVNVISQGYTFYELANLAVAVAILLAGGLSLFYVFFGGISFILSAGHEDKVKQAVHTIRYAIIGLIVTFIAVSIIAIVGSIMNFNLVAYLNWDKINFLVDKIINSLTSNTGNMGGGINSLK